MSPTRFRERGLNETIRFATSPCELGLLLVAATERGVCSVMLGDERRGAGAVVAAAVQRGKGSRGCRRHGGADGGSSRRHDRAVLRPSTFRWMCVRPHFRRGYGRLCARFHAARRAAMQKWLGRSVNRLRCAPWPGLAQPTRSLSLFHATVLSAAMARSPATVGADVRKLLIERSLVEDYGEIDAHPVNARWPARVSRVDLKQALCCR